MVQSVFQTTSRFKNLLMNAGLQGYGLVPFFTQQLALEEYEQGRLGRVTEVQRSLVTVFDGVEERALPVAASLLEATAEDRPTVGDWVVLDDTHSRIDRVLDRKSAFRRMAAGEAADVQLIAANIDTLFIVTSCNEEFKESRLERYLAIAANCGVTPVILLTKIDLADDSASYIERARNVQPGIPVESINALDSQTFEGVNAWIESGSTIALVGSSGVGKSTIVNALSGAQRAATGDIREDDKKGRHTTSFRALYRLANGGLLIDVPGIREIKVSDVDEGLATVFDEITALAAECRFLDCNHEAEPGCAVRDALESGELDGRRWQSYRKLLRENAHHNASLADKRSRGREFARMVREAKEIKKKSGR